MFLSQIDGNQLLVLAIPAELRAHRRWVLSPSGADVGMPCQPMETPRQRHGLTEVEQVVTTVNDVDPSGHAHADRHGCEQLE